MTGSAYNKVVDHAEGVSKPSTTENLAISPQTQAMLENLYRTEARKVTGQLIKHFRDRELALDMVQEAFARIAQIPQIETLPNPRAYFGKIIKNLRIDWFKSGYRKAQISSVNIDSFNEPRSLDDQYQSLEDRNMLENYERIIQSLPEKTRRAFILHRFQEMTYKEIGEVLGISIPSVQYHVARAVSQLDQFRQEQDR